MEKFQLNLLCSTKDTQPAMNYVKVTQEHMVATDAHILAAIPTNLMFDEGFIEGIPEDGMLIHAKHFQKLKGYDNATWLNAGEIIKLIDSKKEDYLIECKSEEDIGTYPNWEAVMPKKEDRVDVSQIGVNFALAAKLQKAMDTLACKMTFTGKDKAILVEPEQGNEKSDIIGLIMPVRLD